METELIHAVIFSMFWIAGVHASVNSMYRLSKQRTDITNGHALRILIVGIFFWPVLLFWIIVFYLLHLNVGSNNSVGQVPFSHSRFLKIRRKNDDGLASQSEIEELIDKGRIEIKPFGRGAIAVCIRSPAIMERSYVFECDKGKAGSGL